MILPLPFELRWLEIERCEGPYVRVGGSRTYKLQMRVVECYDEAVVMGEWKDVPIAGPRALPTSDEVRSLS